MFLYIKHSLNVHFSELIMMLWNTLHAWTPGENRSRRICSTASHIKDGALWALCLLGDIVTLDIISYPLYTNSFWVLFMYTKRKLGIVCGFMHHHLNVNNKTHCTHQHPEGKKKRQYDSHFSTTGWHDHAWTCFGDLFTSCYVSSQHSRKMENGMYQKKKKNPRSYMIIKYIKQE